MTITQDNQHREWDKPVPTPAFASSLKAKLLTRHAELTAPSRRLSWKWLIAPVMAAVIALLFVISPREPLSADSFLERAEGAVSQLGLQEGIQYTKKKELMTWEENPYVAASDSVYFPYNVPVVREMWIGTMQGHPVMMTRDSAEDGTLLQHRLDFYEPGDDLMIYSAQDYVRWKGKPEDTPLCMYFEETEEEKIAWQMMPEEDMSGTRTTYIPEDETDLRFDLESDDMKMRVSALRELQERGSVREVEPSDTALPHSRVFRSDIVSEEIDEEGNVTGTGSVTGYFLFVFDEETYRLVRQEQYGFRENGQPKLWNRTDHLEQNVFSDAEAPAIFDPKRYDLQDPWNFVPVSREDVENDKEKQGCYANGKWVGANSFELRERLGEEAESKMLIFQFAR